ncbi:hypothetical protein [Mesorhizobium sp. BHbdii]
MTEIKALSGHSWWVMGVNSAGANELPLGVGLFRFWKTQKRSIPLHRSE